MTDVSLRVDLPAPTTDRSYEIVVGAGLIGRAGELIRPLQARPFLVVVTDENVARLHGDSLGRALARADIRYEFIVLPPGEATKSAASLTGLMSRMLALGVERTDVIVAFGGGVIGDVAGLAAALVRRGCRFVQIPTTLLAQVDSSVGGKTAINAPEGKNLIGAFHQPSLVIADVEALATLPRRELLAGYAEVVKYAALGDAGFFDWLDERAGKLMSGDRQMLARAVEICVAAKAAIVARDETEKSERRLLNLGHTFGHALEAVYGFSDALLHGEAVAVGMALAFDYSVRRGLAPEPDAASLKAHLASVGLPTSFGDLPPTNADRSPERLVALMRQDKKMAGGKLALVLAAGIGKAFVEPDADLDDVRAFLAQAGAP
ncbi:MAG: 3-dehydroquinate synthase [Alphaproteobacteria bacterium]|nr:3-dehydroquinate synthase [Alphaproteobacteria bacterium]